MEHDYIANASEIFTVFFIMLGPLRLVPLFAFATKDLDQPHINSLAWKSALIMAPLLVLCGYVGMLLLNNWQIKVAILELTAGLIFAYVAFTLILKPKPAPASQSNQVSPLGNVLNTLLTPYGIAALVALLAASRDNQRVLLIFGLLFGVIFLNYIAMVFVRYLYGKVGKIVFQVLIAVLGVLQAALALSIIHNSLTYLQAQMASL